MADLEVRLESSKSRWAFGEALMVTYTAQNVSGRDLFVVADRERVYRIKETDRLLRVVVGQLRPTLEFDYFEFRPPKLRKLARGTSLKSKLSLGMPLRGSAVAPDGGVELIEVQLSDDIEVRLEIGYGTERFRARSLDPFSEFLTWQRFAVSKPIALHVASRGPIEPVAA